jgi:hypothetical protein
MGMSGDYSFSGEIKLIPGTTFQDVLDAYEDDLSSEDNRFDDGQGLYFKLEDNVLSYSLETHSWASAEALTDFLKEVATTHAQDAWVSYEGADDYEEFYGPDPLSIARLKVSLAYEDVANAEKKLDRMVKEYKDTYAAHRS